MSTAIIYATTYGSTRDIAEMIQRCIPESVIIDVKKDQTDISAFDSVILGSSIYVGQIDKQMKNFININGEKLKQKRIGIYFCCAFEENVETYLKANFDKELTDKAVVMTMGGKMDISKMSFAHKMITRMVQKSEQGKNREVTLHPEKVEEFVKQMFSQTE